MLSLSQVTIQRIDRIRTIFTAQNTRQQKINRKDYGLVFCVDGCIHFEQNETVYPLDCCHVAYLPKGGCYRLRGMTPTTTLLVDFECDGTGLSDEIHLIPLSNPESYLQVIRNMMQLQPIRQNRAKILSLTYELLHRLDTEQARFYDPIQPAVEYMHKNYTDVSVTNGVLAEISGISEIYFRKRFQQRFGISPHQYLLDLRISHAKQLLMEGRMTVSQLAEASGFSGVYHFSRTFKNRCGITPSRYAMQSRLELL